MEIEKPGLIPPLPRMEKDAQHIAASNFWPSILTEAHSGSN